MTIKRILALPANAETATSVMTCALYIARGCRAHVAVAYVRGLAQPIFLAGYESLPSQMSATLQAELEAEEDKREVLVRRICDDFIQREHFPDKETPELSQEASARWEVIEGRAASVVANRGGAYDLIVMGRPSNDKDNLARSTIESALFATGSPVLVAPPEPPKIICERILIGWNKSAQSARAFHAAKALHLEKAKKVRILSVTTGAKEGPAAQEIADNLAWHGIEADIRELSPDSQSVGAVLLAEASAIGADLVVMGGYTHSRFRQIVFGGVTNHVLTHATVPVFLAH